MISRQDNRLSVTAAMTMETVGPLLDAGSALFTTGEIEVDLAAVSDADSAALALVFEWQRIAQDTGTTLVFANLPPSMISLATLYGVLEMIPERATAQH